MKRSEKENPDWLEVAHKILDDYEINPERKPKLTWSILEEATGFKRKKLWNTQEIYSRYTALRSTKSSPIRRNDTQRLRKLERENEDLKLKINALQEKFVLLYEHVENQGSDPEIIFQELYSQQNKL